MTNSLQQTTVSLDISDNIAEISLNGPEGKPPTLDQEVLASLEHAIAKISESGVRITYLVSNSEKFFCVGANISVLKETNPVTIGPWVRSGHRIFNQLEDLHCPVVAIVRGYVMGGGLELAMACDLIFASDNAKFAQSEARLGFITGWGGSRRLVDRVGRSKAKYMFFSSTIIGSGQALDWGLVEFSGTDEELDAFRQAFTDNVLQNNANACATFKKILNDRVLEDREKNMEKEAMHSLSCLEDPDTVKRLMDFLSKKK